MSLEDESFQAKLGSYDTELENGIFNLVIALCQKKAEVIGMEAAKQEVSTWLKSLIRGLGVDDETTLENDT